MYNRQKNLVLYLLMVGVCVLDYLFPSPLIKLDSDQTQVETYNERGAQLVKGPKANQHKTEQKVILFFVDLY